jgi:hypothetical protein
LPPTDILDFLINFIVLNNLSSALFIRRLRQLTMSQRCPICARKFKSVSQHWNQTKCGLSFAQGKRFSTANLTETTTDRNSVDTIGRSTINEEDDQFPCFEMDQMCDDNIGHSHSFPDANDQQYCTKPEGAFEVDPSHAKSTHTCTDQEKGYVRILTFVEQHNLPLYVYDDLMDLLKSISYTRFDFSALHPKRDTIMKKLSARFSCPVPKAVEVSMEKNSTPNTNPILDLPDTVNVLRFDFRQQLQELLSSDIFHDMNNLVVDPSDPFGFYNPPDGRIGELHSGDWYRRTYKAMIKDPAKEMLIGVKLYCDKTGTDSMMMRHGLEPVMFTLTIIKQSVQQKNFNAWKHIGFIPDLDQRSKAEKKYASNNEERKGRPTRNYHRCLEAVLMDFLSIPKDGLELFVRIGPYVKLVKVKLPVSVIVGDAKCNDIWCCRVLHHNQNRMSRACYTPADKCSDHLVVCRWVKQSDQHELLKGCMEPGAEKDKKLQERLKKYSTIRCYSCLFRMNFGANPHGQFRSCTIDMMHLFENGWVSYVCQAFIRPLRTLNRTMLDLFVEKVFKASRSTQRKNFPRTNFSGGVTNLTQLASHEWVGVLLTILMAAQTHMGARILSGRLHNNDSRFLDIAKTAAEKRRQKKRRLEVLQRENLLQCNERWELNAIGEQRPIEDTDEDQQHGLPIFGNPEDIDAESLVDDFVFADSNNIDEPRCSTRNFVQLAEMMLCFHAFYKRGQFWKINNKEAPKQLESALRRMMLQLTSTLNRGDGTMNWNLQKIHEILHLPIQMVEYGSPSNYDAGTGESGLKHWAKRPAARSLKGSIDVFTTSTASRVHEGMVIAKAANCLGILMEKKKQIHVHRDPKKRLINHNLGRFLGNRKYVIYAEHDESEDTGYTVFSDWLLGDKESLPEAIFDIYFEEYFQNISGKHEETVIIDGFTEYMLPSGEVVRAHPNYGGRGPLYDWSIIEDPSDRYDYLSGVHVPQLVDEQDNPIISRIEKRFPKHVPARLIAFFRDSKENQDMAIVHACRPWSAKNYEHSSVITESWNLQVVKQKFWKSDDGIMRQERSSAEDIEIERMAPMYHVVPAHVIKEGLFAVQEDDMLAECWPSSNATGHVLVVHDRDQFWSDEFLKF